MSEPTAEMASSDPDLEVGTVVGEYEIEEKVGQGGFGTVYRAVHPVIGKVAAVKVLARRFSADPEMVSRFVAEARSVNQIRHRHIIDIFLFGTLPDGRAYYVMEYLDGEPLDAMIDRDKPVPLAKAIPILRAIARALDAAHAKGIAHRDLKPENVFLVRDPDGGEPWPKLLDFGIAKLMGQDDHAKHKTRTGIPIGTPYYMSPEQCRGKDVDHRTDYYAFGIVAYEMLTGVHPIDADDFMEIMIKQLNDEPVPPSQRVPELPAQVDETIAWLMKKNRDERPPSLALAMKAFDAAAENAGIILARPTMGWDAVTPPIGLSKSQIPNVGLAVTMASSELAPLPVEKKKPLWLLGVVAAVIAAGIAVFALTRPSGHADHPAPTVVPTPPTPAPVVAAPPVPAPAPVVVQPPPQPVVVDTPPVTIKKPIAKPKPAAGTTKPKPNHDDIIDVFGDKK